MNYTVGIHDGHNASVAVIGDGLLLSVIQEERLRKEKNYDGFPQMSMQYVLSNIIREIGDIDRVIFSGRFQPEPLQRLDRLNAYSSMMGRPQQVREWLKRNKAVRSIRYSRNQRERLSNLRSYCIPEEKVVFCDHHYAHACAAIVGSGSLGKDKLVFTNDGSGDGECATVGIYSDFRYQKVASVSDRHSVGLLYAIFTYFLGMVPLEHEYKIMGMAPYSDGRGSRKVADQFHDMFQFSEDGLTWKYVGGYSVTSDMKKLSATFRLTRFDHLMGGLQLFIEEHMRMWVTSAIEKTGVSDIVCSGGTFMNVKANRVIMEDDSVSSIFVYPSCGDESNSIGAAYSENTYFKKNKDVAQLSSVYLGPKFANEDILNDYLDYQFEHEYKIEKVEDIELVVARLLDSGEVVARFQGREEFGARSLGNRAILAKPSSRKVVKEINAMIKMRDFWMPFACSVIDDDIMKYVVVNDKCTPYFMIMTYDTTNEREDIAAGIHPYDYTVRPQLVTNESNPRYYKLLKNLRSLCGTGAVLNTSLNLHGLPLVHDPGDAFNVLDNSSLKYLAIEDYLISKVV